MMTVQKEEIKQLIKKINDTTVRLKQWQRELAELTLIDVLTNPPSEKELDDLLE